MSVIPRGRAGAAGAGESSGRGEDLGCGDLVPPERPPLGSCGRVGGSWQGAHTVCLPGGWRDGRRPRLRKRGSPEERSAGRGVAGERQVACALRAVVGGE